MHSDKERDMARSLLPSRWRGAAAAKARARRATRRQVAALMASLEVDPDAWDDLHGAHDDSDLEVRAVVWRRRSADKVNPFIRWATQTTRALPKGARLHHLRGVLPKGLIGSHARSHLERLPAFDVRPRPTWRRVSRLLERGHLANVLREALEVPGGHALVNEVLSRHALVDARHEPISRGAVRLLHGVHDVLPLLEALEAPALRPQRYLLDALCRALWRAHFDLEQTRQALPSPVVVPPWRDFEFVRG